jgi:hypothetical protein
MVDVVSNSLPAHVKGAEYENVYRLQDERGRGMCIKHLLGRCADSGYCRHSHGRFKYDVTDIDYSDIVLDYGTHSLPGSLPGSLLLTHSLPGSLTHSLTHSLTYSLTRWLTHSLT